MRILPFWPSKSSAVILVGHSLQPIKDVFEIPERSSVLSRGSQNYTVFAVFVIDL